jgi:uncharacterized iron-regulated membrane protein
MARWWFRLHFWTATLSGAIVLVLAVTGCLLAFEEQLDRLSHYRLAYVSAAGANLPVSRLLASVKERFPDDDVVSIAMERSPRLAWQVAIPDGIVYVNPHTGQVNGLRERGQTVFGIAHELHTHLAAGHLGASVIRWSDLAMAMLLVSGVALWWPRREGRRLRIGGGRAAWSAWHKTAGILSVLFLLIATVTGGVISFEESIRSVLERIGVARRVDGQLAPSRATSQGGGTFLDVDRALARASALVPGGRAARIQMPEFGGAYKFLFFERNLSGPEIQTVIMLDPYTAEVRSIQSDRQASAADRFFWMNEAVHTGAVFGLTGRVVMSAAAWMVVPQAWSGLVMWWKRRRSSAGFEGAKDKKQ